MRKIKVELFLLLPAMVMVTLIGEEAIEGEAEVDLFPGEDSVETEAAVEVTKMAVVVMVVDTVVEATGVVAGEWVDLVVDVDLEVKDHAVVSGVVVSDHLINNHI